MLSLLLSLALAAGAAKPADAVVVGRTDSEPRDKLADTAIDAAVEEIRRAGRAAFLQRKLSELAESGAFQAAPLPDDLKRAVDARLLMLVDLTSLGTTSFVLVKVIDTASANVVSSERRRLQKADEAELVGEVRSLVRKVVDALPAQMPAPTTKKQQGSTASAAAPAGPPVPAYPSSMKLVTLVRYEDDGEPPPTLAPGAADQAAWLAGLVSDALNAQPGWQAVPPSSPSAAKALRTLKVALRPFGSDVFVGLTLVDEKGAKLASQLVTVKPAAPEAPEQIKAAVAMLTLDKNARAKEAPAP